MGTKFSDKLAAIGFKNVLGTTEYTKKQYQVVGMGQPFTCRGNQGVYVVYDEAGVPWAIRLTVAGMLSKNWDEFTAMNREFPQKEGAYVPHSNDGGGRDAHSRQYF